MQVKFKTKIAKITLKLDSWHQNTLQTSYTSAMNNNTKRNNFFARNLKSLYYTPAFLSFDNRNATRHTTNIPLVFPLFYFFIFYYFSFVTSIFIFFYSYYFQHT